MIKVRQATIKDRPLLKKWFKGYPSQEVRDKRVNCYTSHNFTIIALDGDKLVGVTQWYLKENPKEGIAEIEEVFVDHKYRGQGIASQLITTTIQNIKEYFKKINIKPKRVFLFVDENNQTARKLYEKIGFKINCKCSVITDKDLIYTLDLKK